jgi:hypothetical protein
LDKGNLNVSGEEVKREKRENGRRVMRWHGVTATLITGWKIEDRR